MWASFPTTHITGEKMNTLTNKHFLKLLDLSTEEIAYLLDLAAELKAKKTAGIPHR